MEMYLLGFAIVKKFTVHEIQKIRAIGADRAVPVSLASDLISDALQCSIQ